MNRSTGIRLKAKNVISRVGTLNRIRHFRGHGIHSPFVYSLVRNVFMEKKLVSSLDTALYDRLRSEGVGKRTALQLQNFYSYCRFTGFEFPRTAYNMDSESALWVIMPSAAKMIAERILEKGNYPQNTVVIVSHRTDVNTRRLTESLAGCKKCMSIDKRDYIIFLFDRKLPVQHYKL